MRLKLRPSYTLATIILTLLLLLILDCTGVRAELTAKSVVIMDAGSGKILFSRNIDQRMEAASTVKVLTALMAAEQLDSDAVLTVSKRAQGIAPTKAYLTYGAGYKVRDLIQALLMSSANDAGVILAEAMGGTEFRFSIKMVDKAKSLGAKNSFFLNATGLPETGKRQFSTARDLARFMRELTKHPELMEMMHRKQASITGSDGKKIPLRNHNKFLWKKQYLIGKTGYTRKAGHCFLGMFRHKGRSLIVAMQGSRRLWGDLEYLVNRGY